MKTPILAVLAALAVSVACDKVALTSPTGSTITITSDRAVLPLNGQATVRAVVIEASGTPVHNGTTVTFTSTLGTVDPVEAQTVNGIATATFNAGGISGKSTIKAFSGGANTATGVDVTIGSAAAKTLAISATPSSVSQSGGTVTVAAMILDESGNPLPGVSVAFTADAGQLNPAIALSDSTGTAKTQLSTTQTSKVTATAGAATGSVTVNVSSAPTVTIEPPVPSPAIVGSPVAITVTTSSGGSATPRQVQSLTVDFGDGTSETRQNVTGSAAFTHTYNQARGYTITATAVDVAGNTGVASRALVVQPSNPTVSVSANPNFGTAPFNSSISGTASPTTGGPPIASVRVFVNGEQVFSQSGGGSYSFAHRFTSAGTYNVSTIATDTGGNEARANTTVIAQ